MNFLEPWVQIKKEDRVEFLDEIYDEIPSGHPLYGVPFIPLAKRQDSDDVLFQFKDGSRRIAQVHLTWSQSKEKPGFPLFQFFPSINEWSQSVMLTDHAEFTA